MNQDKKLLIGTISTVFGNPRNDNSAMIKICDEIHPILIESEWFSTAPFTYVSLVIVYGNKTKLTPKFSRIIKTYGELPIAIELKMDDILAVHLDKNKILELLRTSTIQALLTVADKYCLPKQKLKDYEISIQNL